ncbi:GA113 protein, partial [Calyptomena viridis]|nr:GA113 protein [Calyptomena viridis]
MERQAYDLFTCFLEKRQVKGIDLCKELPGLLAYGFAQGFFQNPHTVHEITEWRKFGDKLWGATLDDDKTAKKLGKQWRVIYNTLLQYQIEQKAAQKATEAVDKNGTYNMWPEPSPSATTTVLLPSQPQSSDSTCSDSPNTSREPSAPSPPWPEPPSPSSEPVPGAESDLAEAIARERREAWAALTKEVMGTGDKQAVKAAMEIACPVTFTPVAGRLQAQITALDWKLLVQLRATVSQFGVTSEPAKQMLDYIWNAYILLPNDCRNIAKLIFSEHQRLLFGAHWQAFCTESVAARRQPGDPLHGLTMDELMGTGPYMRTEAQAILGPEKLRESMRLVRAAIDRVKAPGGTPSYMGIKQGREEALGIFVDRVAAAIEQAGVPEYMKGAMLKQCILQNSNQTTKNVLHTLGAHWGIEELLERMANIPVGPQAMLVEAINNLGIVLKEQAAAAQNQVLAALALLQATAANSARPPSNGRQKCFRCGGLGHIRRECRVTAVWCSNCRSDTHSSGACRRRSGNGKPSASSRRAQTQVAAANTSIHPSSLQQQEASGWTRQPQ